MNVPLPIVVDEPGNLAWRGGPVLLIVATRLSPEISRLRTEASETFSRPLSMAG